MQQHIRNEAGFLRLVKTVVPVKAPASSLTEDQRQHALSIIFNDAYYSQTMVTLTTGVFIAGLAIQLQAPNFVIGLLAAIPFLAQLLQFPGIYLVDKLQSRTGITVIGTLISRLFLLPMALAPLIPDKQLAVIVLIASYLCQACTGAIATCSWNSWIKDVMISEELGSFFSRKLALCSIITMAVTLAGGFLLEQWAAAFPEMKLHGYSILLLVALVVGLLGVRPLRDMAELPLPPATNDQKSIARKLAAPLKNRNYRSLIKFLTGWNFAINLAVPFFTVYMLSAMHMPISTVTTLTILNQLANLLSLKTWGKLTDRFSNKSVLRVCGPLFLLCVLAWAVLTLPSVNAMNMPALVALQMLLGVATAGVTLANGNIAMKLAPKGEATSYLATNNIMASMAAGISPLLGGLVADFLKFKHFSFIFHCEGPGCFLDVQTLEFNHWTLFFGLAFIIGLMAIGQLQLVREHGDVKKRVIIKELMNDSWRLVNPNTLVGCTGLISAQSEKLLRTSKAVLSKRLF